MRTIRIIVILLSTLTMKAFSKIAPSSLKPFQELTDGTGSVSLNLYVFCNASNVSYNETFNIHLRAEGKHQHFKVVTEHIKTQKETKAILKLLLCDKTPVCTLKNQTVLPNAESAEEGAVVAVVVKPHKIHVVHSNLEDDSYTGTVLSTDMKTFASSPDSNFTSLSHDEGTLVHLGKDAATKISTQIQTPGNADFAFVPEDIWDKPGLSELKNKIERMVRMATFEVILPEQYFNPSHISPIEPLDLGAFENLVPDLSGELETVSPVTRTTTKEPKNIKKTLTDIVSDIGAGEFSRGDEHRSKMSHLLISGMALSAIWNFLTFWH